MRKFLVLLLPVSLIGAPLAACSSDDSTTPAVDASAPDSTGDSNTNPVDTGTDTNKPVDATSEEAAATTGTIQVDTTYTGAETGTLAIGIFAGTDVSGVPVDGARIANPTFPNHKSFANEIPGQYTIIVYLDVGNDSPTGPGAGDIIGSPVLSVVTVDAGATTAVPKDLDPPSDAGTDG